MTDVVADAGRDDRTPTFAHRIEYLALRAFVGALAPLGVRGAASVAGAIAQLGYWPVGIRRGVVTRQIAAAFPEAPTEIVAKAIARRVQQPFASGDDLAAALGQPVLTGVFGASTQYFAVDALIRFERVAHRVQLQIARPLNAPPAVISRIISNA